MTPEEQDTRHRIFRELFEKFAEQEKKLIRQALTEHLKRPPSLTDANNTFRVFIVSDNNKYTLKFKEHTLGTVTYDFPDYTKGEKNYTITFKPVE